VLRLGVNYAEVLQTLTLWMLLLSIPDRHDIEACGVLPRYKRYQIDDRRHRDNTEGAYGGGATVGSLFDTMRS